MFQLPRVALDQASGPTPGQARGALFVSFALAALPLLNTFRLSAVPPARAERSEAGGGTAQAGEAKFIEGQPSERVCVLDPAR